MSDVLDTVLGILSTIGGIFGEISAVSSRVMGVLNSMSMYIFLGGFFGLLFAFLWFLFRYLDKKRLTMPVVMFTLFFLIFLGGNLLLISSSRAEAEAQLQAISAETQTAEAPEGEEVHI